MVVVFPLPEEGRGVNGGRGKRTAGVTQPLPSLAETPRGSFHPPDDDLTRTTEGSFPPSRFPNSSNFALMEYAGAKIYLSFCRCPIQKEMQLHLQLVRQ